MNLLANAILGYFDGRGNIQPSLVDWNFTPGTWYVGVKAGIPAAQCDQDMPRDVVIGWPTGVDGYLWQDVIANPLDHTQITFSLSERQHHGNNTAVITIYGLIDGVWVVIWQRDGLADVPLNTVLNRDTWYPNTYTISASCPAYRLKFHGRIDEGITAEEQDKVGWEIANLYFEVS